MGKKIWCLYYPNKEYYVLIWYLFYFPLQVDDCGFSLSHPNQFFFESQRILNGGKDIKKESIQPETPQHKASVQKTKEALSSQASLNSSLEMDIEGLESYFSDWFLVILFPHWLSPRF